MFDDKKLKKKIAKSKKMTDKFLAKAAKLHIKNKELSKEFAVSLKKSKALIKSLSRDV